jgi:large subunit ribosomal protein L15
MELHNLKPAEGAIKRNVKRLGRGQGSGRGGTSTRGHKGAQSRSGYHRKHGFEGGQMPLQRRIPKFGFNNINRVEYTPINLDVIQKLCDESGLSQLDKKVFVEKGLAGRNDRIKILGRGQLTVPIHVKAHAFSASARAAIEAAGGTAEIIAR